MLTSDIKVGIICELGHAGENEYYFWDALGLVLAIGDEPAGKNDSGRQCLVRYLSCNGDMSDQLISEHCLVCLAEPEKIEAFTKKAIREAKKRAAQKIEMLFLKAKA